MEIEVVAPKLNDTEKREVNLGGNISQINPSSETKIETVEMELLKTPMGGSTRESITSNTNNKSRSRDIFEAEVPTQHKQDNLVETNERSECEGFPKRSTAFTSQNVNQRRYQTRSASRITIPRKLKD